MEVYINKNDWDKIINYARCSSDKWGTEIGGMAVTIQDKDGDWQIKDPVIMKQEVSAALCELDKTELAQYYSKMEIKYKKDNMRFCWWHSHAEMQAFWSGTDTNTIDEYSDGDLSFALVVNVKEEYKCRVSVWKPFEMHEDVELTIVNGDDKYKVPKKIEREVAEMCTKPERNWYNSGSSWNSKNQISNNQTTLWKMNNGTSDKNMIGMAWSQLIEKVDEINSAFIAGEFQYDTYANKIKDVNRRLEKANMPLQVNLLEQCSFEDLLHTFPWDLIECTAGYEAHDPTDSYIEMHDYNYGYNLSGGGLNGKK